MLRSTAERIPGSRTVDVLQISDFRFPGGTSASIAEEIAAQAAAGWNTGLVHLNGPLVARATPFNSRIRDAVADGAAQLLVGHDPLYASVTLIRHPTVFQQSVDQLPPISTDQVLVIANTTLIAPDGATEYDPARITDLVRERFGVEPRWAPLSPVIRDQLLRAAPGLELIEDDWLNVIDADPWYAGHRPPTGEIPVIGRHSRGVVAKWPSTKTDLQNIYPLDGSALVHVLGGAGAAREVLESELPRSWRIWPFGAMEPRQFLQGIDVYVYYPHPKWVEAFGRNVLEAMAAGVPVVLPPRFEPIFGDAARYAEPTQVGDLVRALHSDPDLWQRTADHARQRVAERFSHQVHRDRLRRLTGLGEPTGPDATTASNAAANADAGTPGRTAAAGATVPGEQTAAEKVGGSTRSVVRTVEPDRPRLLLISSNGTGMGHLMRLMAYGRRATDFEPHVLSLSQGVGAAGALGMPFEYVPSANALGMNPRNWQPIFTERVGNTIDRIRPSVVVFDGTWPYSGIERLRSSHPDPIWIWSRRGMWMPERSGDQLTKSSWFDEVLEPGDFASAADVGPTAKAPAIRIAPVTLLDSDDLLSREEARAALGLPATGRLALVAFSGGAVQDVTSDTAAAIAACRKLGIEVCVTWSVVSPHVALPADVHVVSPIPLATYQRAFDVAISAAGYNSFHELLRFGTPTLFIPKRNSSLDDQDRRARWAADQGWSHYATQVTATGTADVLADLLERGPEMMARVAQADPGNGAVEAARLLTDIHTRRAS